MNYRFKLAALEILLLLVVTNLLVLSCVFLLRFVCSRSGHVLEIDYKNVCVRNARRLLPSEVQHSHRREKQTFNSGDVSRPNGSDRIYADKSL